MTHFIIVKFNDTVADRPALCRQIEDLFLPAAKMTGIYKVQLFSSCVDRPNRHDLMIRMEMEPEALAAFDASVIHRTWKERFGRYVLNKAIFDTLTD